MQSTHVFDMDGTGTQWPIGSQGQFVQTATLYPLMETINNGRECEVCCGVLVAHVCGTENACFRRGRHSETVADWLQVLVHPCKSLEMCDGPTLEAMSYKATYRCLVHARCTVVRLGCAHCNRMFLLLATCLCAKYSAPLYN